MIVLCALKRFQMCERCNRRTESTKRLSIQRFPQVIVIRILGHNISNNIHLNAQHLCDCT